MKISKNKQISYKWKLVAGKLEKTFNCKNFMEVISLVNKIAEVAEQEKHHPDLDIYGYKNLKVKLFTHETKSVSEKDYKLASKIDLLVS